MVAYGISNTIDHPLTRRPIIERFFIFSTVPVKFFANTIETDNLENFYVHYTETILKVVDNWSIISTTLATLPFIVQLKTIT